MLVVPWLAAIGIAALAGAEPQQQQQRPLGEGGAGRYLAEYTTFRSDVSPAHSLRIKSQGDDVCDARSAQYTGWLDVGRKHLFFWYFESRDDPAADPLVLWLNGGPGASSMLGMLQELGPCLINEHGNGTVHNPYGWSANANVIFVDSPAGVGFSYADEGEPTPDNSFSTAQDLHHFLQLFVGKVFPDKAQVPFVITGESYGGHYIPTLGAEIVAQNALRPRHQQVNLKSVAIGNGYISPRDTHFGYWETLCTTNPGVDKPILNTTRCDIMAENIPRCVKLADVCYKHKDHAICNAASEVCWEGVVKYYDAESGAGGRNRYDITDPCVTRDDNCYPATANFAKYLNSDKVWKALEVPKAVKEYIGLSWETNLRFSLGYDLEISMEPQVKYLLESGIDVLIYQGNLDLACNTAGNSKWAHGFAWKGQTAFVAKPFRDWTSTAVDGHTAKKAGYWKQVDIAMIPGSDKTTTFAFVTVDGAGHLVPQDQPEVALDMINRWLHGGSFASSTFSVPRTRHDDL